jgi:hypothetical protein
MAPILTSAAIVRAGRQTSAAGSGPQAAAPAGSARSPGRGGLRPYRPSRIEKLRISRGHVFVFKPESTAETGPDDSAHPETSAG